MDTKDPNTPQAIPVHDGAEAFVELLVNNGVEYIFINSGTDTYPILEAISRMNDNAHYLHDVMFGSTIGLTYGLALFYRSQNVIPPSAMIFPIKNGRRLGLGFATNF